MNISYNWLKQYIDIDLSPVDLAQKLTAIGLEANIVEQFPDYFKSIRVGYVISREKHPDADKLSVCHVDMGDEEPHQIICGAPNVASGQKVAVATLGTTFPNGMVIKKAKLRGVFSNGMICSERELELSENHDGIMVLDDGAKLGTDMTSYLSGNDVSLELDLTPDRSDALGHIGVARDLSALLNIPIHTPVFKLTETGPETADLLKVEIQNPQACPRYAARIVNNVKISESPSWLRQRLQTAGIRSINNVVDAANYVLMETGHPLHTFDSRYIEGGRIVIRMATDKEKITTLDGKVRELDSSVLLICDAHKPVAVAGVMGGENSEVKDDTTDLILESAYFDPVVVRRGARKLQLATDASHRFERGTDPNGIPYALDRLAGLIIEVAGGELTSGQVDNYPVEIRPVEVDFRVSRCNKILGTQIPAQKMMAILKSLGMEARDLGKETFRITIPTFRPDVTREIDLVEEVARIYGYDNIPIPEHFSIANKTSKATPDQMRERVMDHMAASGFNQILGNSLVSVDEHPAVLGDEEALVLANPLSREMATMRTSLFPGMMKAAIYNVNRRQSDLKLFEMGQVSTLDTAIDTGAREQTHLAVFISGELQNQQWSQPVVAADLFHVKGLLASLFTDLFKERINFSAVDHPVFSDALSIVRNEKKIGILGKLREDQADSKKVNGIYAELHLPESLGLKTEIKYENISVFPSVERDLSFMVDSSVPYSDLERVINENSGKYLIYSRLYDIYEGKSIARGKKSLT
ncbi:MAG: phenylalanine--tRNA ligase subunit beta, partial [Candidatus Marinimicrobia bacterium]|nr:phenylalanine--tRNA ligase subunit beta [Candidatus Neomarinimicrobiota bacterium]